jgi:hypothetical protein
VQDVPGREGLLVWMVATNVLNNQIQTTDEGWSSSMRIGFDDNFSL